MDEVTALSVSETGKLLALGIEKNLDVDKLKALMDLRDREDRRRSERDFEDHFALMQKDYIPAFKSKDVKTNSGGVAYYYCPLPVILSVYAPILARHGFSYRWEEEEIEGKGEKKTTCFLSGYGFSRQASISLPYGVQNGMINPIQARGATSEYGRRYTFMNVTGCIVADEMDTDGVIDKGHETPSQPQQEKHATAKTSAPGYTVPDEPIPKDYKERKAAYKAQGYGCVQDKESKKWLWVKYGVSTDTQEPEKTATPSKITASEREQLQGMMDEMGYNATKQYNVFQKAEKVGSKVAIDAIGKEYDAFLKAQETITPTQEDSFELPY